MGFPKFSWLDFWRIRFISNQNYENIWIDSQISWSKTLVASKSINIRCSLDSGWANRNFFIILSRLFYFRTFKMLCSVKKRFSKNIMTNLYSCMRAWVRVDGGFQTVSTSLILIFLYSSILWITTENHLHLFSDFFENLLAAMVEIVIELGQKLN